MSADARWLGLALQQARLAARLGEVPVGAVLVAADGCTLLAAAHNACIAQSDPSAHAEIQALRCAAQALGNYRLDGCTLYVTLEPCAMCAGAMLHARLQRVVYAAADPKSGAAGSLLDVFAAGAGHAPRIAQLFAPRSADERALQQQCAQVLSDFFAQRRAQQAAARTQAAHAPLRQDALRIPDARLEQPHSRYALLCDGGAQPARWRWHYLATPASADVAPQGTALLLHGYGTHAQLWAPWQRALGAAGWNSFAPDLPGWGRSDKPKHAHAHSLPWHSALLRQWLRHIQGQAAKPVVCVTHADAALLALDCMAADAQAFAGLLALGPCVFQMRSARAWRRSLREHALWQAPFANAGHRAAFNAPNWGSTLPESHWHEALARSPGAAIHLASPECTPPRALPLAQCLHAMHEQRCAARELPWLAQQADHAAQWLQHIVAAQSSPA